MHRELKKQTTMLDIKISLSDTMQCELSLPTRFEDITPEYLTAVTEEIHVPPYYALVGLISKESPAGLVLSLSKKTKSNFVTIIPVLVKTNLDGVKDGKDFYDSISVGQKLIVGGSDLSIGNHVNAKNNLIGTNRVLGYLTSTKENHTKAISYSTPCCFVDFKIIPITAIRGAITETKELENPFVKFNKIKLSN